MKEKYTTIEEEYENIVCCEKVTDVPEVAAVISQNEQNLVKELAEKGIDAEEVYQRAVRRFEEKEDKLEALRDFILVKKYKDSIKYINRINRFFNFNNELFDIGGKTFTTKLEVQPALNVATVGKPNQTANNDEVSSAQRGRTYVLCEVINAEVEKKPVCKGISYVIASYGSRLFFVKNNTSICRYNIVSKDEIVIDKANPSDYKTENNNYHFFFTEDGENFFYKKKLEIKTESKGCIFKKVETIENKNNYSVELVNLESATKKVIIDEAIDILDYFDDKIFYTYSEDPKSDKSIFMVYDITTDTKSKVLDENCLIHKVYENKVVYSIFEPNAYNLILHSYNLEDGTDTVLEENIYDFFEVIDGKVYYTIGNEDYQPLFSINFDGTNRQEILRDLDYIDGIKGGWMYALKGFGRNKALWKISVDGKKRICLCSRISRAIKFASGYVYYTDLDGDLYVVRNDGKDNRLIIESVDERNIIIDDDYIYFMRRELVADGKFNNSLYRMAHDGSEFRKMAFDVLAMQAYDDETIYLSKSEVETYEVKTPTSNKDFDVSTSSYKVKSYYAFNKNTCEFTNILSIGRPTASEYEFKNGCFKAPVKVKVEYKRIPNKAVYKRAGKVKAGSNFEEGIQQAAQANNASTQCCGCLSNNSASTSGVNTSGCKKN